jgi:FixJ family two-component response regulator
MTTTEAVRAQKRVNDLRARLRDAVTERNLVVCYLLEAGVPVADIVHDLGISRQYVWTIREKAILRLKETE